MWPGRTGVARATDPAPAVQEVSRRRLTAGLAGGLVLLLAASPRARAEAAAAAPPEPVRRVLGGQARLRGSARLRMLGLSIYDARLWVVDDFDPQRFDRHPLALELVYARALSGTRIAERSIEEMRRGGPLDPADERRWLAFMSQAFPDVDSGDRITGTWEPDRGRAAFQANTGPVRAVTDAAFGTRFFGIWLAPHTSQPAMRQQLLGASPAA